MVCADETDSGCDEVLRDVWLFLDDEMDPENRAPVKQHLDDCSPCLEEAGLDAKLKALLQRKVRRGQGAGAAAGTAAGRATRSPARRVTAGPDQLRVHDHP